jgi:hypothetical protein
MKKSRDPFSGLATYRDTVYPLISELMVKPPRIKRWGTKFRYELVFLIYRLKRLFT